MSTEPFRHPQDPVKHHAAEPDHPICAKVGHVMPETTPFHILPPCVRCGKSLVDIGEPGHPIGLDSGNMATRVSTAAGREVAREARPPLGVMPKKYWDRRRLIELCAAMGRYAQADEIPPRDWFYEAHHLRGLVVEKLDRDDDKEKP